MNSGATTCWQMSMTLLFSMIVPPMLWAAVLLSMSGSSITFNVRHELTCDPVECICIKIKLPFTAPVLVINVYRPPSSDAAYDTSLVTCINVVNENKECSIVGDFNDHALGPKPCSNKFLKNMHSLGLKQIVNNPANSHRSQEHR